VRSTWFRESTTRTNQLPTASISTAAAESAAVTPTTRRRVDRPRTPGWRKTLISRSVSSESLSLWEAFHLSSPSSCRWYPYIAREAVSLSLDDAIRSVGGDLASPVDRRPTRQPSAYARPTHARGPPEADVGTDFPTETPQISDLRPVQSTVSEVRVDSDRPRWSVSSRSPRR